jgi:hypothetical protein
MKMPSDQFHDLIGKALVDKTFRDLLFTDRTAALGGYQLSVEEIAYLDQIDQPALEARAQKISSGHPALVVFAPVPTP